MGRDSPATETDSEVKTWRSNLILRSVAVAIPILFVILPQASCTGRSFTGFQLIQTLLSNEASGVGTLVFIAAFAWAGACLIVGIVGWLAFQTDLPLSTFRRVGFIGVAASILVFLALEDRSLQGLAPRLEFGFWLVALGFVALILSPLISNPLLGESDMDQFDDEQTKPSPGETSAVSAKRSEVISRDPREMPRKFCHWCGQDGLDLTPEVEICPHCRQRLRLDHNRAQCPFCGQLGVYADEPAPQYCIFCGELFPTPQSQGDYDDPRIGV